MTVDDVKKIYRSGRMDLAVVYLEQLGYTFTEVMEIFRGWDDGNEE